MSNRTFEEIVPDLAAAYTQWKTGESDKNTFKDEFFQAITDQFEEEGGAERLVEETGTSAAVAQAKAIQRYPTWNVDAIQPKGEGLYEIILTENPEYMPFSFEYDGKVYQRSIISGSFYVDDKRLKEEDEDLYYEVTEVPHADLLLSLGVGEEFENVASAFGFERQVRDLNSLSPHQLASLAEYTYEGKPTVKLPAPKEVK